MIFNIHARRGNPSLALIRVTASGNSAGRVCKSAVDALNHDRGSEPIPHVYGQRSSRIHIRVNNCPFQLTLDAARRAGIQLGIADAPHTLIEFDAEQESVFVERCQERHVPFYRSFAGCYTAPIHRDSNDWIRMIILVDRCSVELFADPGDVTITDLIFPERSGLGLFSEGEIAVTGSVAVYPLCPTQ